MSKTAGPQFPQLNSWDYPHPQYRQVSANILEDIIFAMQCFQRSLEKLSTHIPLLFHGKQVSSFSPGTSSFPTHLPQHAAL